VPPARKIEKSDTYKLSARVAAPRRTHSRSRLSSRQWGATLRVVLPGVRRESSGQQQALGAREARLLVRVQDRQVALCHRRVARAAGPESRTLRKKEEKEKKERRLRRGIGPRRGQSG